MFQAWEHALAAKRQDITDHAADLLGLWRAERGTFPHSAALGARHMAAFPESVAGLQWAGFALFRAGDLGRCEILIRTGNTGRTVETQLLSIAVLTVVRRTIRPFWDRVVQALSLPFLRALR